MIPEVLHRIIAHAFDEPPLCPSEDDGAFFWVEWGEDDDQIPGLCEKVLKTGQLSADWDDEAFVIVWRGKRLPVPLRKSLFTSLAESSLVAIADSMLPIPVSGALSWPARGNRHVTLLALNQAVHPDYEIRFVRASSRADSLAFVPLAATDWSELEQQHGRPAVEAAFLPLREHPNLFTEEVPPPDRLQGPGGRSGTDGDS